MASNDSDAAVAPVNTVAAPVNTVVPTPPQTENKTSQILQENHEPSSTKDAAVSPAAESAAPVVEPKSESAASISSSSDIPSIPAVEDLSTPSSSNSTKEPITKSPTEVSPVKNDEHEKAKEVTAEDSKDKKPSTVDMDTDEGQKDSTASNHIPVASSAEMPATSSDKPSSTTSNLADAPVKTASPPAKPIATIKPMVDTTPSHPAPSGTESKPDQGNSKPNKTGRKSNSNKRSNANDDVEETEKKAKLTSTPSGSKGANKTPEQILEYMEKTFDQRRKMITKQMPTIPELKSSYPDLFKGKQLLLEFQRITKIDIDKKIQEFCVRHAEAVIDMARDNKAAAPVLARWEQAKQENESLKQYWDMVTALCLLPLHFGENFVEMVLEIEEDEEVKAQGKIVPTLVARGNIFRTDEFFLIAENTIVQEFEEFTIAFASLYSSYWVFNMVYPETIENTYSYIQRCIVRQREPGQLSAVGKNFTKALQNYKWNKENEGK